MEEKCCKYCRGLACDECVAQTLVLPLELVMELGKQGIILPLYYYEGR